MTQLNPQQIEDRLRETPVSEPPAGLLERIQEEIPDTAPGAAGPQRPLVSARRRWLVAASFLIAVTAVLLAYRTGRETDLVTPPPGIATDSGRPELPPPPSPPGAAEQGNLTESRALDSMQGAGGEAQAPVTGSSAPPPPPPVTRQAASETPTPGTADRELAAREIEKRRAELVERLRHLGSPAGPDEGPPGGSPSVTSEAPVLLGAPVERRAKTVPIPEPTPGEGWPRPAPPSTGGTTEPNDRPYGDMFFRSYGTNPFIDTEDDRFSTFGLDVDTGSWGVVRAYLEEGHLPPPEAVRVEEVLNSFDYGDEPPAEGDFALHAQAGPAPFAEGPRYRLVRFAVRGREIAAEDRKPATLVFVVDVSGSMNRENRLGLVKRSVFLLLDQLRDGDRVGLVVYGSRGQVLVEPTGDLEVIRDGIDRLRPGGSTNAEEGLTLGYELARRFFREEAVNRVILCSDGVANVGRSGAGSILEVIGREADRGIELTTVGFGLGNYNDVLMEQLADRGDGRYAYVDDLDEAHRIFVEDLTGTLQTIASDAKVQVEFHPETVSRYRLLGYENRDLADERFRDDTVDAGEIGAGHTVTALYEVKLREAVDNGAKLATLRLRYRSAETAEVVETSREIGVREVADAWERVPRELRLAALVAELAEILKGSYWAKDGDLDEVFRRLQALSAEFPGDHRIAELASLAGRAARLQDRSPLVRE